MAIDTKAHRMIDDALGDSHSSEIAMAGSTIDARSDVWRVVESHVRFFNESVDALPRHVLATFGVIAQGLNPRVRGISDILVTTHAEINAGNSSARAGLDARMASVAFDSDLVKGMDPMRKIDRLLGFGSDAQKVFRSVRYRGVRGCENRRTPPARRVGIGDPAGVARYVGLLHTARQNGNSHEPTHLSDAPVAAGTNCLHCSRKEFRSVFNDPPWFYNFSSRRKDTTPD
jgi:hypothetical protein